MIGTITKAQAERLRELVYTLEDAAWRAGTLSTPETGNLLKACVDLRRYIDRLTEKEAGE